MMVDKNMNTYLMLAGALIAAIGVIHSFLGEKLIFSRLRAGQFVPTMVVAPLTERHIRIVWATWHVVSLLGFSLSALLFWLSLPISGVTIGISLKLMLGMPILLSGILVMWATKGRHPGWVGLTLVSGLIFLS